MNSSELKSYLTGLILGDGYLDKGIEKRAFRIKSTHKDFVEKIRSDLNSCTNFKLAINYFDSYIGKEGTNHNSYYELTIKAHPYFAKIYHRFYDDFSKRIINDTAIKSLSWSGWANWFMSDGYICKVGKESGNIVDRRVELCTDRYSESGVNYLAEYLRNVYGYKIKIVVRGKVLRIRFGLESAQDFLYNISPFVVESFSYKLDMAYNYRPTWMNDNYYNLMLNVQQHQSPTN